MESGGKDYEKSFLTEPGKGKGREEKGREEKRLKGEGEGRRREGEGRERKGRGKWCLVSYCPREELSNAYLLYPSEIFI